MISQSTKAMHCYGAKDRTLSTHYIPMKYGTKKPDKIKDNIFTRILIGVIAVVFILGCIIDTPAAGRVINNTRKLMSIESITPKVASNPFIISTDEVKEIYLQTHPIPIVEEVVVEPEPEPVPPTPMEILNSNLGSDSIDLGIGTLTRFNTPDVYYPGLDYSSFQPYMSYKVIKDRTSAAWKVVSDPRMYIDENGMCRFETDSDTQFTIDGQDDFVIALGTYYKPKGTCGDRWLVVTTTGAYTAITGDEKSDAHTDEYHMFSSHKDGTCGGIIEWLVDTSTLDSMAKRMGTLTHGPVESIHGDILYIYRID